MEDVFLAARDIGCRIAESGVYADYAAALARVRLNPQLVADIAGFKRAQAEFGRSEMTLDREKHLSKLYFDLCMNADADAFFKAEKKMLALMLGVHDNLWAACDTLPELFTAES